MHGHRYALLTGGGVVDGLMLAERKKAKELLPVLGEPGRQLLDADRAVCNAPQVQCPPPHTQTGCETAAGLQLHPDARGGGAVHCLT